MNLIQWAVERTIAKYTLYLQKAKNELAGLPDETIYIKCSNGSVQIYEKVVEEEKVKHKYLKKDLEKTIPLLKRKYYKQCIQEAEVILQLLNRLKDTAIYKPLFMHDPLEKIWDEWPDEIKLFSPLVLSDYAFKEHWEKEQYSRLEPPESNIGLLTEKGEYVRSKSERMIADKLFNLGIPYRYEEGLTLGDRTIYPDFSVLNLKSRKVIRWEHLGMMDKMSYEEDAINKIKLYMTSGFWIGKNIIFTYETKNQPLQSDVVDDIINSLFK